MDGCLASTGVGGDTADSFCTWPTSIRRARSAGGRATGRAVRADSRIASTTRTSSSPSWPSGSGSRSFRTQSEKYPQLAAEVIRALERLGRLLLADLELVLQRHAKHERRLDLDAALGPDDRVAVDRVADVADRELGQPVAGEAERDGHRVVQVLAGGRQLAVGAPGGDRERLGRLGLEQVPDGVDRVRPHVEHRPGRRPVLGPVVVRAHVLGEHRRERPDPAHLARAEQVDHGQRGRLEVQPVGDHQLHARPRRLGVEDLLALGDRDLHRLLEQHVDAGPQGGDGELGVPPVRRGDVDRVHLPAGQQGRELVVGVDRVGRHAPPLGHLGRLGRVAADQGRHDRVARVGHARHERLLGDVAQGDDAVADLLRRFQTEHALEAHRGTPEDGVTHPASGRGEPADGAMAGPLRGRSPRPARRAPARPAVLTTAAGGR